MINTFDVRASERKSDIVFSSLNRLHDAKQSGALTRDEFSKLLVSVGDLFANKIKQGKVTEDEIESVEAHLTGFIGENSDKYFSFPHIDLDRASKTVLESIDFARQSLEKRNEYAQPVMEADSYERTFRKLGH
jgi:hypothetical protein